MPKGKVPLVESILSAVFVTKWNSASEASGKRAWRSTLGAAQLRSKCQIAVGQKISYVALALALTNLQASGYSWWPLLDLHAHRHCCWRWSTRWSAKWWDSQPWGRMIKSSPEHGSTSGYRNGWQLSNKEGCRSPGKWAMTYIIR